MSENSNTKPYRTLQSLFFSQEPNNDRPKAVMVNVHGGGFETGFGDEYTAEYLIEYDVILVTINYRLNVFGEFPAHVEVISKRVSIF